MPNDNPLANDAKLQQLLQDVGSIKSDAALASWRTSFLKVYQKYLDPDGVLNARDADGRLAKKLQGLAKASLKVQTLVGSKNISSKQVTAEGWNGINNLNAQMKEAEAAINAFCPKTSKDEDKVGYDKFELGAVLIKDGFHVYEIMTTTKAHILELREGPLDGIIDSNSISIMDFYFRGVDSFIDVMADLGLMGLAKQCVEVYQKVERPKPSEPGPNGEPPQDDYSEFVGGEKGKDPDGVVEKAAPSPKDKVIKGKHRPGKKTKQMSPQGKQGEGRPEREDADEEGKDDADGDGGEGDFVLYWDPTTESFGKMPRDKLAPLIIVQDDKGAEVNNGAIDNGDEKAELVWLLKKLEKKKEKEEKAKGNWLDQIKKEKAAKNGGKSPTNVKGKKKPIKSASERPTSKGGSGWGPSPLEAAGSSSKKAPGRTKSLTKSQKSSPSAARARPAKTSTPGKALSVPVKRSSGFEDYQGKYKSVAPKPASDGWGSVVGGEKKK